MPAVVALPVVLLVTVGFDSAPLAARFHQHPNEKFALLPLVTSVHPASIVRVEASFFAAATMRMSFVACDGSVGVTVYGSVVSAVAASVPNAWRVGTAMGGGGARLRGRARQFLAATTPGRSPRSSRSRRCHPG